MRLHIPAQPACLLLADAVVNHYRREQYAAEVGGGVLVVAAGDGSPLLEAAEAAFDGVAVSSWGDPRALRIHDRWCLGWPLRRGRCPRLGRPRLVRDPWDLAVLCRGLTLLVLLRLRGGQDAALL